MRRGIFKRKKEDLVEASLLSFKIGYINLMKTLVPVLLSLAVFSRLAILDLHLPNLDAAAPEVSLQRKSPPAAPFSLTVAIETEGIAVSNGERRLASFPNRDRKRDIEGLSALMQRIKKEHPDQREVIILSEPKTVYEELIAVMDACRSVKVDGIVHALFPNVSLGEASWGEASS